MANFLLKDLSVVVRSLGRGVVFYTTSDEAGLIPARWSPGSVLYLQHLGDTEGDIGIARNPTLEALTTPELTGGLAHELDYTGEAPVIEIPLYLTDPELEAIVSPIGLASAGRSRRSAPNEHTLAIFSEALFLEVTSGQTPEAVALAINSGVWTVGGNALSAYQQGLLGQTFWGWRGVFNRPDKTFHGGAGDARKNIETVTFTLMHHPDMPEGHHAYTVGDPTEFGIDLEGGS